MQSGSEGHEVRDAFDMKRTDVTDAGPYVSFGWKFDETLFGGLAKGGNAK